MIEVRTDAMAHGGDAIGRVDGKAHFVDGALPGELVRGEIVQERDSWNRVRVREVLQPSPSRVEPRCRHFGDCGGCQWQHGAIAAQREWKETTVRGQLEHVGGIADPPVRPLVAAGPAYGYRNRMDFRVRAGRPALHRKRSRDLVSLRECHLLDPGIARVFGRLGELKGVQAVTLRTGVATGETLAVVTGRVPDDASTWGCGVAQLRRGGLHPVLGSPCVHEVVAGITFRISGLSFFQANTAGAAALVDLVADALDPGPDDGLVDAFAGVGLFAATVGAAAGRVSAIELAPTAVADLAHNLDTAGIEADVLVGDFTTRLGDVAGPVDLLVVDPPRVGLRADGVAAAVEAGPAVMAYVSCDPAALARDAALLAAAGYRLDWVTPVDLFPQTWHIEAVARFSKGLTR